MSITAPKGITLHSANVAQTFLGDGTAEDFIGLVRPSSEDQVQKIIRWANDKNISLLPISSPSGPRIQGAKGVNGQIIVLDMSRLSKLIFADGSNRIALIEPGVTFGEIDILLKESGMRCFKPFLPRKTKSVLSAFLDREPILSSNDHWDTMDPLSSFSLVFGNGDRFKTGGAALPGTLTKQIESGNRFMNSTGPSTTDYSRVIMGSQGTLGVVCWASIYCEPIPPMEKACLFGSDTLLPLMETVRQISLRKIGSQTFILNKEQMTAALADNVQDFEASANRNFPKWMLFVNLSASNLHSEESLAWKMADLSGVASLAGVVDISADNENELNRLASRLHTPTETYFKSVPKGHFSEVFCLTQLSNTENLVSMIEAKLKSAQIKNISYGFYVQPTVQGVSAHVELTIFHEAEQSDVAQELIANLSTLMADNGGFFSRPYDSQVEDSFNRASDLVPHLKKVKSMFDPQGVLSPGRLCF